MNNPNEPMKGCYSHGVYINGRLELIEAETAQEAQDLAKSVGSLYAVHVVGPDEILAAPSKEEADARAKELNAFFLERSLRTPMSACVIRYPGTPESHAEEVKRWRED